MAMGSDKQKMTKQHAGARLMSAHMHGNAAVLRKLRLLAHVWGFLVRSGCVQTELLLKPIRFKPH